MTSKFPTSRHRSPIASLTSHRALLGVLAVAPVAAPAVAGAAISASPNAEGAQRLFDWASELAVLQRTRAGRSLSRVRYRNAKEFFAGIEEGIVREGPNLLYHTGIVMQLGLSAHLLDVGFDDRWCARHIGLHIDRALALANMAGLGLDTPEIERLARFLSPYSKWRHADLGGEPACPWSGADVRPLTRMLLDHVRSVTGHARPTRAGRRCHD